MKIDPELAAAIAKNDEQTVALAAAEAKIAELQAAIDTAATGTDETGKLVDGLTAENEDLKSKLAASAQSELDLAAASVELNTQLSSANEQITQLTADLDAEKAATVRLAKELEEASAAKEVLEEVAATAEETKTAVQDQLENLNVQLLPKGTIPDLEAVADQEDKSVYNTWLKLSKSPNAEDKMAARKLMSQHKAEIEAAMEAKPTPKAEAVAITVSAEDKAVYEQWCDLQQKAKEALTTLNLVPKDKMKLHTESKVAARVLFNKNKAAIERCISAHQ